MAESHIVPLGPLTQKSIYQKLCELSPVVRPRKLARAVRNITYRAVSRSYIPKSCRRRGFFYAHHTHRGGVRGVATRVCVLSYVTTHHGELSWCVGPTRGKLSHPDFYCYVDLAGDVCVSPREHSLYAKFEHSLVLPAYVIDTSDDLYIVDGISGARREELFWENVNGYFNQLVHHDFSFCRLCIGQSVISVWVRKPRDVGRCAVENRS